METSYKTVVTLKISGMTCINCQTKIQNYLSKTDGILKAKVSWKKAVAEVEYDGSKIQLDKIIEKIEELDYKVIRNKDNKLQAKNTLFYVALITLLFLMLQKTGILNLLVPSSIASSKMSYALLFVTGLFTSVHCVAMCGGINLSQSLPKQKSNSKKLARKDFTPALLYNLGRICSYSLIGLAFGTAGFFITGGTDASDVSIPLSIQSLLKLIAGIFMILMGISLLDIFPFLRNITPHLPAFLSKKITSAQINKSTPFIVGFLNGFMPCGPLQAMWVVALASANPFSGALSMLAFSAGTVPLMLGFGSLVSFLGKKYTGVVMKAGAVLVAVMGLSMVSQGFALGGLKTSGAKVFTVSSDSDKEFVIEDGKQIVKSTLNPFHYPEITVKKGIPVHWEIEATEGNLNGCNYKILFRDFGFMYQMGYGTNVIEFTPKKAGTYQYTCWMGMVRGTITVKD